MSTRNITMTVHTITGELIDVTTTLDRHSRHIAGRSTVVLHGDGAQLTLTYNGAPPYAYGDTLTITLDSLFGGAA